MMKYQPPGDTAPAGFVREMRPGEKRAVSRVMRRSFNWFTRLFFDFGSCAFVYELEGEIVAGITLKTFRIGKPSSGARPGGPGGEALTREAPTRETPTRGGLVKWVFTAPEARGQRAAGQLVDRALVWFREQGCSDVFACIEGYNTGSANTFARLGFSILSLPEQLRRYRFALPRVWVGAFHLFDVGHFLWVRRESPEFPESPEHAAPHGEDSRSGPGLAFAGTILLQSLALYLAALRWGDGVAATDALSLAWQVLVAVLVIHGVRLAAMATTARAMGRKVEYRPWETGLLLSLVLGLVGWGPFPVPGSLYPPEERWSYRDELPWLGPIAYVGGISVLLMGWLLHVLTNAGGVIPALPAGGLLAGAVAVGAVYTRILLIFEVLVPTFPFSCYNGRRVLDWRRASWAVLALGTILLWVVSR